MTKIERTAHDIRDSLNLAIRTVDQALSHMLKSGDPAWCEAARDLYQIEKRLTAIRLDASIKSAARRVAA